MTGGLARIGTSVRGPPASFLPIALPHGLTVKPLRRNDLRSNDRTALRPVGVCVKLRISVLNYIGMIEHAFNTIRVEIGERGFMEQLRVHDAACG